MQLSVEFVPSNTQRIETNNTYKTMKQLFITLAMVLVFGTAMMAQTVNDSLAVAEDSVVTIQTAEDSMVQFATPVNPSFFDTNNTKEVLLPIILTVIVFATTVAIVFIIFYFRHRTKKAQYDLVSQALAAGKELPEGLFASKEEVVNNDVFAKGVKNAAVGLGLGVFLWAITGEFGIGCIGFILMLMGIGQIIIYKTQKAEENKRRFYNIPQPAKPAPVRNEIVEEKVEEKEVEIIIPENDDNSKAE